MSLDHSINALKGIGSNRQALLNKIGIHTIGDLLEYFPREHIDRSRIFTISELQEGQLATIKVFLTREPELIRKGNMNLTKITFADETGSLEITWFNQPYMRDVFKRNNEYFLSGRVTERMRKLTFDNPEYENVPRGTFHETISTGRIVPVYPLTKGISQKVLRSLVKQALENSAVQIEDFIPPSVIEAHKLVGRATAIRSIHFPETNEDYYKARRRLVFEELFVMQAALMSVKAHFKNLPGLVFTDLDTAEVVNALPFCLTRGQKKVLDEIVTDFGSGHGSNRLLQGDVGSGKTAVAMILCFLAVKNGAQAALMAPTETLATQHYHSFNKIFSRFDMSIELLTGSVKAKEKTAIKAGLKSGDVHIVIGTHALIQDNVNFANLGLVITDEQHRFGVRQRSKLNEKGTQPHLIVMTATPIPRSLSMVLYGDMDISTIPDMPPGRLKIDTYSVTSSYHPRIFSFIAAEIEKGHQAYIICPLINESESEDFSHINSVLKFAEELKNGPFRDIELKIMHGKMKTEEKSAIMSSFAAGETKVLVSTTVVEVGVDVPNATVILIENAERFGLSQLHQLRGRVGRSDKKSHCILVTDSKNPTTKKRMKAMEQSSDGFELSELDLKIRGPGEFFGAMQYGIPNMRLANLYTDAQILAETSAAINNMFHVDNRRGGLWPPTDKQHAPLQEKITKILGNIKKISL